MYNYYNQSYSNHNPYAAWNAAVEAEIENQHNGYEVAVTGVTYCNDGCAATYPTYNYTEQRQESVVYTGFDLNRWNAAVEAEFSHTQYDEEECVAATNEPYPFANTVQQQQAYYGNPQQPPYMPQQQPMMYQGNGFYPQQQYGYPIPPVGTPGNYYGEMIQRRYGIDDSIMTAQQIELCRQYMDTFDDPYRERVMEVRREANRARYNESMGIAPGSRTINRQYNPNAIPYVPVDPEPEEAPQEEVRVDNNGAIIVGRDKPCPYTDIITNRPLSWEEYDGFDIKHKKAVYDKYTADCRDRVNNLTPEKKEDINEAIDRGVISSPFDNAYDEEYDFLAYQDAYEYPDSCPSLVPETTIIPDMVQDFDNAALDTFSPSVREEYLNLQMEAESGNLDAINKFRSLKAMMLGQLQERSRLALKRQMEGPVEEPPRRGDGILPFGLDFSGFKLADDEEEEDPQAVNPAAEFLNDRLHAIESANTTEAQIARQVQESIANVMASKFGALQNNPMMMTPPRGVNPQNFVRNIQEVPYEPNLVNVGGQPPVPPYQNQPIPPITAYMGNYPQPIRYLPGFGNSSAPAPIDIIHMDKEMLMNNALYYDREDYIKQERERAENEKKQKEDEVFIWKKLMNASLKGLGMEATPEMQEYFDTIGNAYLNPPAPPVPDEYDIIAYTGRLLTLTTRPVDGVNVVSPSMEPFKRQYREIYAREKKYHPDDVGFVEWCNEYVPDLIFAHEMEEVERQRAVTKKVALLGYESVIENFENIENDRLFWYLEDLEHQGFEVYIEDGMLKFSQDTVTTINENGEKVIEVRDPVPIIDILKGKESVDVKPKIADKYMIWEGAEEDENGESGFFREYRERLATVHERRARVQ